MKAVKIAKLRKELLENKKKERVKLTARVNTKEKNMERDFFDSFYDSN